MFYFKIININHIKALLLLLLIYNSLYTSTQIRLYLKEKSNNIFLLDVTHIKCIQPLKWMVNRQIIFQSLGHFGGEIILWIASRPLSSREK